MDSRKESGGAYQELKYTLRNIKKLNKDNIKFVIISVSKNLNFIKFLDIKIGSKTESKV